MDERQTGTCSTDGTTWTVVPRQRDGTAHERRPWPAVTIARTRDGSGRATFNVAAWRAMGGPDRVAFCHADDGARVGWRPDPSGTSVSTARQTHVPRYVLDAAGVELADVLGVHAATWSGGVLSFVLDAADDTADGADQLVPF